MKSNVKRLFAGPYILWMIGFTIIPLLLIVYYGLTTKSGAFTLANVCSITTPEHMKALLLSLGLSLAATAICLLFFQNRSCRRGRTARCRFHFLLNLLYTQV